MRDAIIDVSIHIETFLVLLLKIPTCKGHSLVKYHISYIFFAHCTSISIMFYFSVLGNKLFFLFIYHVWHGFIVQDMEFINISYRMQEVTGTIYCSSHVIVHVMELFWLDCVSKWLWDSWDFGGVLSGG